MQCCIQSQGICSQFQQKPMAAVRFYRLSSGSMQECIKMSISLLGAGFLVGSMGGRSPFGEGRPFVML